MSYLPGPTTTPPPWPLPHKRSRWRLVLAHRGIGNINTVGITDLMQARSVRLEQALNSPSRLTFTMGGRDASAALIQELIHDVWAFRWDEWGSLHDQYLVDVPMFRGPVTHSQDAISEQANTVNFTCMDNLAMLTRRLVTQPYNVVQRDQDLIVYDLVDRATAGARDTTGATSFYPGSHLPIVVARLRPDEIGPGSDPNNPRPPSGRLRDRTYKGSEAILDLIDNLAHVIDGFDYDIIPHAWRNASGGDMLRVFYPQQGQLRDTPILEYGSTVSALSRSVNAADYANFVRVLGDSGDEDVQLYAEAWSDAANDLPNYPEGLWQSAASDAADVTTQSVLTEKARGSLDASSTLEPSYTLSLRPGWYRWGHFHMGDTVPLRIRTGRLNVNTLVRVVGLTYDVGDDGAETVEVTVGKPATSLGDLLRQGSQSIDALTRR